MRKVLLLKFGELFLKGRNRREFIKLLKTNILKKLREFEFVLEETQGRLVLKDYQETQEDILVEKLQTVFGLIGVARAVEIDAEKTVIEDYVKTLDFSAVKTFKVEVKRADKTFEMTSMEFEKHLGGVVLEENPSLRVDLYNPEQLLMVEIRVNKKCYVYTNLISCAGGLPLGSAGKGLLLLSGGIDSPVAGYMVAKRGLRFEAVHFHSYPYTSVQAKEKVIELAKEISVYCDEIKLHIVSFTEIQEQIHKNCDADYMITIMRRIMMRIAERLCLQNDLGAIITGESLGQVASQTMHSMNVTNSVVSLPVFRPLIAFDKEQIMDIAKKIQTYETSILPYEDCCTVFLPKNPVIKPTIKRAEYNEKFLDVDALVESAIANEEILIINNF
ncbi:MAG: tRNA 4-thiouridine(8) synthase ThiI [Clostridiales bacterium]|nr:tRNA 4-thiouridine(8) synthase ThiI [Clostridiales bacterium]